VYQAIVFLPLIGCAIAGLFGRLIGARASEVVTSGFLVVAALLSWVAFIDVGFYGRDVRIPLYTWFSVADLKVEWALRVDPLVAVMLVVVTSVSALVHVYSIGYMHEDPHRPRFFAYLSLFTFAMLMLVTADNLVQLYFGWEGVGLASYLLIGFWYYKPEANAAAIKAFLVNRVGDFGFALGIFAIYAMTGSVGFETVFASAKSLTGQTIHIIGGDYDALTVICLLLFMGAMGKSAQLPLHTWLPDAMEGPTPVSALIHAATMVTAGVYLVARAHPIYDQAPLAAEIVAVVGAATALFAATIGCVQYDIKRVLAYSTMSQIGYMILGVGVGAYAAGAFHFMTHAFFKALLFMAAGIVIHNLAGEQDIRKMGGLAKRMPLAYWTFLIGTLAIAGIFPFAGFFSKDAVLDAALRLNHPWLFGAGVVAAGLTAFYMFRLLFVSFFGQYRGEHEPHAGKARSMTIPVVILSALSIAGGWLVFPGHDALSGALSATFADARLPQSMAEFNWLLSLGVLALG